MTALFALCLFTLASSVCPHSLPTVDLDYEVHQAIAFNVGINPWSQAIPFRMHTDSPKTSGGYYKFLNIQYGEPPIGDLRITRSIPHQTKSSVINSESVERVCPQSNPFWPAVGGQWLSNYENGTTFPFEQINETVLTSKYSAMVLPEPEDPRISEDCLYLEVMVLQKFLMVLQIQPAPRTQAVRLFSSGSIEADTIPAPKRVSEIQLI
ncbi:hypothetical protein HO173_013291 [Letharia columbiana]|uniref:Carboxylesterase type B domain-containing protein n=1 Tax=Letharia columbiana TaxID=112416 RepID=A0A8H6FCS4_9LECA|nr:uncharacterized protein HO173_013291 [Letharia columbiana]KAF6223129.1 hypothetical protein HO173_013291 [Letharia columbiana]